MIILILLASAVICGIFLSRMEYEVKKKEFKQWWLGVDGCCYYSPPFTVKNQQITIQGFQEVLVNNDEILYSVIKMNWFGKRTVYGQSLIRGNYTGSVPFQITFHDIPNGRDYKIEVYNGFKLSYGKFKLMKEEKLEFDSLTSHLE